MLTQLRSSPPYWTMKWMTGWKLFGVAKKSFFIQHMVQENMLTWVNKHLRRVFDTFDARIWRRCQKFSNETKLLKQRHEILQCSLCTYLLNLELFFVDIHLANVKFLTNFYCKSCLVMLQAAKKQQLNLWKYFCLSINIR